VFNPLAIRARVDEYNERATDQCRAWPAAECLAEREAEHDPLELFRELRIAREKLGRPHAMASSMALICWCWPGGFFSSASAAACVAQDHDGFLRATARSKLPFRFRREQRPRAPCIQQSQ
jgi:hypothetical protein